MDGNGRWAERRSLPRTEGHREGVRAVRRAVEASLGEQVRILTLFAFSSDNWRRPATEITALFDLMRRYLASDRRSCRHEGVRVSAIGRRDRLPRGLAKAIEDAERATARGRRLWLRIAIDYSAREAILQAVRRLARQDLGAADRPESFGRLVAGDGESTAWLPTAAEVDLVIRTGGERRLSDFLLWESAYAELYFTATMWPDFGPSDLRAALREFRGRDRRFGRLAAS